MIIVYGASGFTGSYISEAILKQGMELVMAGRDHVRVERAAERVGCDQVRTAPLHDREALDACFSDADVVINCAGPFAQIGEAVIEAALRADCHYLDTTGEQEFVRRCYERYESKARRVGRVIVNACAFEVAFGDWAAAVAAADLGTSPADAISVSYAVENLETSRGTRLSILDAMSREGCIWENDRWIPRAPGASTRLVDFPTPFGTRTALSFPSPEVITVPRHSPSHLVQTYASIGNDNAFTRAATAIAPVIAPLVPPIFSSLVRSTVGAIAESTIRSTEVTIQNSSITEFAIVAEAQSGDRVSRCAVSGKDIYRASAWVACLAAERLENEGELKGVLAPSELFPANEALEEAAASLNLNLEMP